MKRVRPALGLDAVVGGTLIVCTGKVKPLVDSVYAYEDVPKAYERILTSRATGKVVVRVDPNVE